MASWTYRGNKGDLYLKITSSTTETILIPGYSDKYSNLTQLVLANTSASVCKVTLKESLGGAVRGVFMVPANSTIIIGNGEDVFLEDTKINTPWTVTCGTSIDSMEITASFKNN